MKPTAIFQSLRFVARRQLAAAFSLIEVLVVTGLLSIIIIGLVMMFAQTQRAYKLGTTQVDVLEGGRMATDLITRDLQQMAASPYNTTNFFAATLGTLPATGDRYEPLTQILPGSANLRTNLLQEVFFLTRENQKWTAVGYFVRTNDTGATIGFPGGGAGSLYRFETNYTDSVLRRFPLQPWWDFVAAAVQTNLASRVLEGVVHFKMRTFTPTGVWIVTNNYSADLYPGVFGRMPGSASTYYPFGEAPYLFFSSNAIPAAVEVELGVLEAREIERARAISSPSARAKYLTDQAGKVHLFRWRVPVRNVDSTVYQR
ncbi:MAG: hypothetical protein QM813_08235 [Verrucomicrobiota bacterium]